MRRFSSRQLLTVENELHNVAREADSISTKVGEHADNIHFENAKEMSAVEWLEDVVELRERLSHVEGLLRAYNIHVNANRGE